MESAGQSAHTLCALCRRANTVDRFLQHHVNRRKVLLDVAVRNLEQLVLGLTQQFGDIGRIIKSLGLDLACECYQLSGHSLLGDNTCVILNVGR